MLLRFALILIITNNFTNTVAISPTEYAQKRCPWIPDGHMYPPGMLGLHEEIEQFYEYMKPTQAERVFRQIVVDRIRSVILNLWPEAIIDLIGSSATELMLPNSDIDLEVSGVQEQFATQILNTKILNSTIAEPNSIRLLTNNNITILTYIDRDSHLDVDVSFNDTVAHESAKLFNDFIEKYPSMPKLISVIKQFLIQRQLKSFKTGGIKSFSLVLMCINFMQLHPKYKANHNANLGVLLVEFFEFYGRDFDYVNYGIRIENGGELLPKLKLPCSPVYMGRPSLLCIEDPFYTGVNVARTAYRFPEIRQAFYEAFVTFSTSLAANSSNAINDCANQSILCCNVEVSDEFIEYRKWIENQWNQKFSDNSTNSEDHSCMNCVAEEMSYWEKSAIECDFNRLGKMLNKLDKYIEANSCTTVDRMTPSWFQCIKHDEQSLTLTDIRSLPGMFRLHTEIESFYKYFLPTRVEEMIRNNTATRIEAVVLQIWPNAKVKLISSSSTGLVLPGSDLDLTLLGIMDPSPLQTLKAKLVAHNISEPNAIEIKYNLRVPIIRFTDRDSKLDVDISLNGYKKLGMSKLIKQFKKEYPVLPKIVFVLKQFMRHHDLDQPLNGGIPSFALYIMCISYFQLHPSYKGNQNANLGISLMDFFEFYGQKFDYNNTAITIRDGGRIVPKEELPCCEVVNGQRALLCIEDPVRIWENAGERSYRALHVKQTFHDAYNALSKIAFTSSNSLNDFAMPSILGKIVHISDDVMKYREWIQNAFQ